MGLVDTLTTRIRDGQMRAGDKLPTEAAIMGEFGVSRTVVREALSKLQAGGMVATFPMGVAYIGDVVEPRDRGAAIGVYTAAMGSGFAVGPLIGSWVAANDGYPAAYLVGASIAVAGAVFGALRLIRKRTQDGEPSLGSRLVNLRTLRDLAQQTEMLMACIANVVMTLSMAGAIFTYFPVYARGVALVEAAHAARAGQSPEPEDELDDPWGRGDGVFNRVAGEIEATVRPLAAVLLG